MKGKERGTVTRFRQDLMRFAGAVNVHIILSLPPAGHPSTLVLAHSLDRTDCWCLFEPMASQASEASCNDLVGKEIFLRRPPPLFDCDFEGDVHSRSHDTDKDWLPNLKDVLFGNFHVMIDMTGDSDSEMCHHRQTTGTILWH